MDTFELQVYQNGSWQFDSYYDNKDLVLSEAERIDTAGRYLGVRVREGTFNEERESSSYKTIFSRLKKNDEIGGSPSQGARGSITEAAASDAGKGKSGGARKSARKSKKSGGGVTWILMGGIALVVIGIGMILALREFANSI